MSPVGARRVDHLNLSRIRCIPGLYNSNSIFKRLTVATMSDIKESGFKSSEILATLAQLLEKMPEAEKKDQIKKTNGVFQVVIKNSEGKEATWAIDLKQEGKVTKGPVKKADVTISMADDTFVSLSDGKLNAQKAFMTGALKVKGNVMLATKLDGVLKSAKAKL